MKARAPGWYDLLSRRETVRTAVKAPVIVACVVLAGGAGFVSWQWVDQWLSQRALAAHLESGRDHAARVLEEVAVLPDELRESSGLAISRTQPGVLWSHNDAGDGPNLYAIDISGRLLAKFRVEGADARDWEDISSGPCPAGMAPEKPGPVECLYMADTGDNNQVRPDVALYIVTEPLVDASGATSSPVIARPLRYRYPGTPNDAEALAVLPNGDLTIVSKGRTGTIDFFAIPADTVVGALASGEIVTARYVGNTGIRPEPRTGQLVTSAALSPDGTTLAVRTYYEVFFYALVREGGTIHWRDLGRPCALGDAEPQGEGIDYLDANTLLLTSERSRGRPGTIHRLQC
jgi:hypothetical protein